MKLKFNDEEKIIKLSSLVVQSNLINLKYQNAEENLSGFILYDDNENIIKDCSEFVYRWDILEEDPGSKWYTNNPSFVQQTRFSDLIFTEEDPPENETEKLRADVDFLLMLNE